MIELVKGNLLDANAEAYVNTVNCVGVMGKGIALQFKERFPDNFKMYRQVCARKELRPGMMLVYDGGFKYDQRPRYIINFPTKDHWRSRSRIAWIDTGLVALVKEVEGRGIKSIAIPALGCNNGGLEWNEVLPRIEAMFAVLPDVHVLLYEPRDY